MQKHQYKRLSIEFPANEYVFLKMACEKQKISMKQFVTTAVMKSIDEYEAYLDGLSLEEVTDKDRKNASSWEEVEKKLGWDKL